MAFKNLPPDLTLPPGGKLAPGSGTLYIGSQQLPADLLASGAIAGFVWYSNAQGFAAGLDYWYIAHLRIGAQTDLFQAGYKPTGQSRRAIWGSWMDVSGAIFSTFESTQDTQLLSTLHDVQINSNAHDIVMNAFRAVFIQTGFNGPAGLQLIAPNSTISMNHTNGGIGTGIDFKGWAGSGTDAYIKSVNANQDVWHSDTSTQTIGTVAGCTVMFDWRITTDFIIDVRFFITCPSAPGVGAGAVGVNLPGSFPAIDLGPSTNRGGFSPCVGEGGSGFYPMMMRFNNGGTCALFTNNNPNSNTVFEGGGAFTLLKP